MILHFLDNFREANDLIRLNILTTNQGVFTTTSLNLIHSTLLLFLPLENFLNSDQALSEILIN